MHCQKVVTGDFQYHLFPEMSMDYDLKHTCTDSMILAGFGPAIAITFETGFRRGYEVSNTFQFQRNFEQIQAVIGFGLGFEHETRLILVAESDLTISNRLIFDFYTRRENLSIRSSVRIQA